jgi:hypothetical protein
MVPFEGSFWPFAITEARRKKTGDSRPSIEARYQTQQVYVEKIIKAVKGLIQQGFLLEEDGKTYIENAKNMAWPPEPINQFPYWQQVKRIEEPKAIKVDPRTYDAYIGKYEIEEGEIIKVFKENNSLFVIIGEQEKYELLPESDSKYFIKGEAIRVSFLKNNQGKVIKLLIHMVRGDMSAVKIE